MRIFKFHSCTLQFLGIGNVCGSGLGFDDTESDEIDSNKSETKVPNCLVWTFYDSIALKRTLSSQTGTGNVGRNGK